MENLYTRISTLKTNINIFEMELDKQLEGDANKITKDKIKNIKSRLASLSEELVTIYDSLGRKNEALEWLRKD